MIRYIDAKHYATHHRTPLTIAAVVGVGLLCLLGLAYSVVKNQQRIGTYPLQIAVVPRSATVRVVQQPSNQTKQAGQSTHTQPRLPSNGTAYLPPGEYTLEVSHPGYASRRQSVVITAAGPNTLYSGLVPRSAEATAQAKADQHLYRQLEQKSAQAAQRFHQTYSKRYPIVAKLPIKDPYYTVGYRYSQRHGIVVTIFGTSPRYRAAAVAAIYQAGFNPADYVLEFQNFSNPLASNGGSESGESSATEQPTQEAN